MRCRLAVLFAGDIHRGSMEIDRVPSEFAYLGSPEAMPVGDEDHGGVTVAVAITFRGLDQLCRLVLPKRGAISPAFTGPPGLILLI